MFNLFSKKKDITTYMHTVDLNKITTIEECRDMIIILAHNVNHGNTTNLIKLNDKALSDYPSLNKLKL